MTLEEFCCKRKKRNKLIAHWGVESRGLYFGGVLFVFILEGLNSSIVACCWF